MLNRKVDNWVPRYSFNASPKLIESLDLKLAPDDDDQPKEKIVGLSVAPILVAGTPNGSKDDLTAQPKKDLKPPACKLVPHYLTLVVEQDEKTSVEEKRVLLELFKMAEV